MSSKEVHLDGLHTPETQPVDRAQRERGAPEIPGDLLPHPIPTSYKIMGLWGVECCKTVKFYPDALNMVRNLASIEDARFAAAPLAPAMQMISVLEMINQAQLLLKGIETLKKAHRMGDGLSEAELTLRILVYLTGITANLILCSYLIRQLGWGKNDLRDQLQPIFKALWTAFLAGTIVHRGANMARLNRLEDELDAMLRGDPREQLRLLNGDNPEQQRRQLHLAMALGPAFLPLKERMQILLKRGDRLTDNEARAVLTEIRHELASAKKTTALRMSAITVILVGQWLMGKEKSWCLGSGLVVLTALNVVENYQIAQANAKTNEVGKRGLADRIRRVLEQRFALPGGLQVLYAELHPQGSLHVANDAQRFIGKRAWNPFAEIGPQEEHADYLLRLHGALRESMAGFRPAALELDAQNGVREGGAQ